MRKTERGKRVVAVITLTVLAVATADAVDANDRFKGGSYDGYAKQDTETLAIPAAPLKGTLIQIF